MHIRAQVAAVYSAAYHRKKKEEPTFEAALDLGPSSMYLHYYLRGLQQWSRDCDAYTVLKVAVVSSKGGAGAAAAGGVEQGDSEVDVKGITLQVRVHGNKILDV